MTSIAQSICRLCQSEAKLLESHIIPKFAIRWLKQTGTGYFRNINRPNIRLQDGVKEMMLCANCEQLFSLRESYFASHLFKPLIGGALNVQYDERFFFFVVSLTWRVLQWQLPKFRRHSHRLLSRFEQASGEWRQYLLNGSDLKGFGHFHMFVADIANENPPGLLNFNMYCTRGWEVGLLDPDDRCYIVTRFGRFFFIAMLAPYVIDEWKFTRIQNGVGTFQIPQAIDDRVFGGWLYSRAKIASEKFNSGVSAKQLATIENHVRRMMPTLESSDLFRAGMADQIDRDRILSNAGKTGRNEMCPCGSGIKFKKCHGR